MDLQALDAAHTRGAAAGHAAVPEPSLPANQQRDAMDVDDGAPAAGSGAGAGSSSSAAAVAPPAKKAGELELEMPFVEKYRPQLVNAAACGNTGYVWVAAAGRLHAESAQRRRRASIAGQRRAAGARRRIAGGGADEAS